MPLSRTRAALLRSAALSSVARGSLIAWLALSTLFAACNRSEREPSPAGSAAPSAAPVVVAAPSAPSAADAIAAPASSQPKAEPATSTACNTDADCRTFSDACGICTCRPLAKTSPDPKCATKRMTCLIDPCTGQRAFCRKGNCAVGEPSDAAPVDATSAANKDASTTDAAAKGSGSAAPAAGTAPKATDAARD